MSEQNPILWNREHEDASPVGRGRAPLTARQRAGCAIRAGVVLATLTGALLAGDNWWVVALGGATLTAAAWWSTPDASAHVAEPSSYPQRAGWSRQPLTADLMHQARCLAYGAHPLAALSPSYPQQPELVARVARASCVGHALVTTQQTYVAPGDRRTAGGPPTMHVWVTLPGPLPALHLATVRPSSRVRTSTIEFNDRYAILPGVRSIDPAWRVAGFSQYASDLLSPQIVRLLTDAFAGLPPLWIRGRTLGAQVDRDTPYRAELTIDVLCEMSSLIDPFVYERYRHRAVTELADIP